MQRVQFLINLNSGDLHGVEGRMQHFQMGHDILELPLQHALLWPGGLLKFSNWKIISISVYIKVALLWIDISLKRFVTYEKYFKLWHLASFTYFRKITLLSRWLWKLRKLSKLNNKAILLWWPENFYWTNLIIPRI